MGQRLDLHNLLIAQTGLTTVYFQPPSTINLSYPCILYARVDKDEKFAANALYASMDKYTITVIDPNPDSSIPENIAIGVPYTSFDRRFVSEGLYHEVYSTYF